MTRDVVLKPGDTVGILGGGQLGRMLALAAAPLGLKTHIYAPEKDSPAFDVSARHTVAAYEDEAELERFAKAVDVVTFEFENVPAKTAEFLETRAPLHPSARALAITQDRFEEKSFLAGLKIPTAPFFRVDDLDSLEQALEMLGRPAVLKTRRFGYDGKGQVKIGPKDKPAAAWEAIGQQPAILEGFVEFLWEFSVLLARGVGGTIHHWSLCMNVHRNHILAKTSIAPADVIGASAYQRALNAAYKLAEALDYRGVLAVEMFQTGAKRPHDVLVNEIAPRVHNSGHWTIEGANTSQFAQHIRAVAGWPLGMPSRVSDDIEMTNLIGSDVERWRDILAEPGAHLHLYGKAEARPGRKMGHVTRIDATRRRK